MKRLLAICFRLSIVAAVTVAAIQLFRTYTSVIEKERGRSEIWTALECAGKVSDERLRQHFNQFGNIDIGKVGCASREFWASPEEIEKARRGEKSTFLGPSPPLFDPEITALKALAAFVAVNLIGLALIGVWAVFKWVIWGWSKSASRE